MSQIKDLELPFLSRLSTKRFVLASTSPRRLEILQQMGIKNIEVIPSNFEENLDKSKYTPEEVSLVSLLSSMWCMRLTGIVRPTHCNGQGTVHP